MSPPPFFDHFQGKNVSTHLKDARNKGAMAVREPHGTEISGSIAAGADAAKETALVLVLLSLFIPQLWPLMIFLGGFLLWKIGRSALLGWARLGRLHRLIEEERYEIEHNREQEKEELIEMYESKGFSGKLLDQVIDVLMADDNRLLKIMLEEELGLTLESLEHPLKQALGAGIGVLLAGSLSIVCFHLFGVTCLRICATFILGIATYISAKTERNPPLNVILWTLALAILAFGFSYFLEELVITSTSG